MIAKASLRTKLLTTVSAAALALMVSGTTPPAKAGPMGHRSAWLSLEGDLFWLNGDKQIWAEVADIVNEVASGTRDVKPGGGWSGRAGAGIPIMPGLSIAAYARFGVTRKGKDKDAVIPSSSLYFYNVLGGDNPTFYHNGSVEHKEKHTIIDFEVRKDVGLGMGIAVTAKGGVRYASFDSETRTEFFYAADTILHEKRNAGFHGIGPRLGLDVRVPVNGPWVVDLSGSGSVLWGRKKRSSFAAGEYVGPGGVNVSSHDSVWNLEGSAAVSYVGKNVELSLGVRAEQWWGVFDQTRLFAFDNGIGAFQNYTGKDDADRLHWGPFVKLTLKTN